MRVANYLLIFLLLAVISVAVLLTIGIQTGTPSFYVAAVWLGTFFFIVGVLALLRGYKRIIKRQGMANERLAEARFLLERRYELLRGRLDQIIAVVVRKQASAGRLHAGETGSNRRTDSLDIQQLGSRLQRSERRIMGRLENELHARDQDKVDLNKLTAEIERLLERTQLD